MLRLGTFACPALWCGRRDLNPHAIGMTQDFKSWVSADSTTPAEQGDAAKSNTGAPEGQVTRTQHR